MTHNHDLGAGYKYSAKDLTLSQIIAIVNSDYDNRGKAGEMAEGWRAGAAFAEKIRTELKSSQEILADSFHTTHSEVFFGHLADFVASAESAVTPAEMNAESLESAVIEVERIKSIIDDLVAENALYEDNRTDLTSRSADGGLTEYDVAKADVLAEAQDQFAIADQQFASHRYSMDTPTVFKGPEWHGPDRISDMGDYRNAYYPDGAPATGPGFGPNSLPGNSLSSSLAGSTSDGPSLQSSTPVATPPAAIGPAPAPVTPSPGGPTVPPVGFPPVTGNPPVRTAPATARPIPGPGPRTTPAPSLPPRSGGSPTPSPTTSRPTSSTSPRSVGQPPINRQGTPSNSRPSSQPGLRPTGQPGGRPGGQTSRNSTSGGRRPTLTTRSNPPTAHGRNSTGSGAHNGRRGNVGTRATGKPGAAPRGVVKPNAGFEQTINRSLPRSVSRVVGAREGSSVKPVTRPAPGRVIAVGKKASPQHRSGSLTRNGVVTNGRKPAAPTWSRTQPVRQVGVPRDGVIGRREYFTADTSSKSQVREARNARRKARLAQLTGTAAPVQNELMTGITDHVVPGVIGRRPSV
ncbi:hypothetical protein FB566_3012 [Stackebrandtia endophytica]|uniref:Uncharacterized protein n=1 Tax=Stackebrandtia endophytica TaxID=1496996 RepID=A0A543AY11_9ACTN|nr:hypothetical protein [Stackebrandtia endophytica]TQL77453.1 hypothetical protein FB566_3012 [Stackebrandtia endophytica]